MSTYFSPKSFTFLRGLARNNDKTWFNENNARFTPSTDADTLLIRDGQPGAPAGICAETSVSSGAPPRA